MIDIETVINRCKRIVEEVFKPVIAKSASVESITKSVADGVDEILLVIKAKTM